MDRWHLPTVEATGKREPRVLFSESACRGVVIDLQAGDAMGEHQVHENALVEVVSGRIAVEAGGRELECGAGTLVLFAPGERRAVRAREPSRILLLLAPWPGEGHYQAGVDAHPERLPEHAKVPPLDG